MLMEKIMLARGKFQREENHGSNVFLQGEELTLDLNMDHSSVVTGDKVEYIVGTEVGCVRE